MKGGKELCSTSIGPIKDNKKAKSFIKCQDFKTSNSSRDNPVGVRCDRSDYSGEGCVGAADTKGDSANEDLAVVHRATRVSIASITTADVQDTSADHVLGDDERERTLLVTLRTQFAVDGENCCIEQDIGRWTILL